MGSHPRQTAVLVGLVGLLSATTTHSTASNATPPAESGLLRLSVRDPEGQPLTARVRIEPATWRERVRLELRGLEEPKTLTLVGDAQIELAPGAYRLVASRGPEWSLSRTALRVVQGGRGSHAFVLVRQVELPGWRGADLHVHTQHSADAAPHGGVDAAELRAEGIELAVATDHNRVGDLGPGIDSVAGAEVTTWAPEFGHFNAFPLQRAPRWRGTTLRELTRELRRDPSVFVQINHPRLEHHIAYFSLGGFDGQRFARPGFHLDVDGLEVWNGYDIARPDAVLRVLAEWRAWVARGRRLTATGGSDCHGAAGHLPGYPRTYVQADAATSLSPELKRGRAFVSNGPLLAFSAHGHGPGETLRWRGDRRVPVELTVLAPDWLRVERAEIWAGERLAWHADIPPAPAGQPLRFTARPRLRLLGARTLHAVVHGGSGLEELLGRTGVPPLAFSNPVFVLPLQPTAAGAGESRAQR